MPKNAKEKTLLFLEYLASLKANYPEVYVAGEAEVSKQTRTGLGWLYSLSRTEEVDGPRFVKPTERSLGYSVNAKQLSYPRDCHRRPSIALSYKGVMHLKSVFDQVLYSNLLWEIQPQTIFEFGLLQGGSALWFVDQMSVQCQGGTYHGFEAFVECIHPSVRHPNLHIHELCMENINSAASIFETAPKPWLVVDDAHANIEGIISFLASRMVDGDYFVLEDAFQFPVGNKNLVLILEALEQAGFWVDTRYTDAFGFNVTQSPNAWLRKCESTPADR